MVEALSNSPDMAQPPPAKGWRKRRDDSGLTTLEWLLIVAAVAGLAALAVVLVQNVVGDTSEQIAGSSARETAAIIAADQVMNDALDADQPTGVDTFGEWTRHWESRCERLNITYGDADITATARFELGGGTTAADQTFDGSLVTKGEAEDDGTPSGAPGTNAALAECRVS